MRMRAAVLAAVVAGLAFACGGERMPTEPGVAAAQPAASAMPPPTVRFTRIYNVAPVQSPPLRPNAGAEAQIVVEDDERLPPEREQCVSASATGACTGVTLDCSTLGGIILMLRTMSPGTCRLTFTARDARGAQGTGTTTVEVR